MMEDPESFSTRHGTNENNNVDFKNVLNGSVLSSLSKTLDLALLENSLQVHRDSKLTSSAPCYDGVDAAPADRDNAREVPLSPLSAVTEEQSTLPPNSLKQDGNSPELSVPSSNCDTNSTFLVPLVAHPPEISPSNTAQTMNDTTDVNGPSFESGPLSACLTSVNADNSRSGEVVADGAEQSSDATSFPTCSSIKPLPGLADDGQTLVSASSVSCLRIESSSSVEPPASISRTASYSLSDVSNSRSEVSTSSGFPRSSSLLSAPNSSFGFPSEGADSEDSDDSSDYDDSFDWDLSGNIEYYDFKDREKVKLKQSVLREQDVGCSRTDFTTDASLMKTSSPFKRKRTRDGDAHLDHHFANSSSLRSGKKFKSSEGGTRFQVSSSSASSSHPKVSTHSSVNGSSNSFNWISSPPFPSSSSSNIKPSSVTVSNVPSTSTSFSKTPSSFTRASKSAVGSSVAFRLASQTPSHSRVRITKKPSLSSGGNTAPPQPNRSKMREVLLGVMSRHKRSREQEAERTRKFAISKKRLLGSILKQLHVLQAQCGLVKAD